MTVTLTGSFLSSLLVIICTWVANEDPGDNDYFTGLDYADSIVFEGRTNSSVVIVLNAAALSDITEELKDDLAEAVADAIRNFCEDYVCISTNTTTHGSRYNSTNTAVVAYPRTDNERIAVAFFVRSATNNILEKEFVLGAVQQSKSDIGKAIGYEVFSINYFSKIEEQDMTESWLTLPVVFAINMMILAISSVGTMGLYITLILMKTIMQQINRCIMHNCITTMKPPAQRQPEL